MSLYGLLSRKHELTLQYIVRIFGYPVDKAWGEAIRACLDFQNDNQNANLDIQSP